MLAIGKSKGRYVRTAKFETEIAQALAEGQEAGVLDTLGMVATAQDDLEKARVFFHQGLELARKMKMRRPA